MDEQIADNGPNSEDCQPPLQFAAAQELLNNMPYICMTVLGAAILALSFESPIVRTIAAALYVLYGAIGSLWIMIFVCPYCRFWNTRACPCGYGRIAAQLRDRRDYDRFNEKFKKHIPVIVPLWFIPLLVAIPVLIGSFSRPLLILLIVFAIDAFAVLPLLATKHGCAECPQKETCPWMAPKTAN